MLSKIKKLIEKAAPLAVALTIAASSSCITRKPSYRSVETYYPTHSVEDQRNLAEKGLEILLAENCNAGHSLRNGQIHCEQKGTYYDKDWNDRGDFHNVYDFNCDEIALIDEPNGINGSNSSYIQLFDGSILHFRPIERKQKTERAQDLYKALHIHCSHVTGRDIPRKY